LPPATPAHHQRLRTAISPGKLRAGGLWAFRPASWPRQTHATRISLAYTLASRGRRRFLSHLAIERARTVDRYSTRRYLRTRAQRPDANFEGCTALVSSVDGTLGPVRRFSLSGGEGANPRPSTCRRYVGEGSHHRRARQMGIREEILKYTYLYYLIERRLGAYIPICPSSRLPDEVRGERGTPRSKLQALAIDPHLLSNPLHRPSSIHQGPLKAASCGGSGVFLRASEVDRRGGFRLVGRGCNLPGGGARGWEQG
jgi:hypothetical protein